MFTKDDMISVYTREQAIADGELVDVSITAMEAGFEYPVALTRAVRDEYIVPDERSRKWGQSEKGRLWDTLSMLRHAVRTSAGGDRLLFQVYFIMKAKQQRLINLKSVCCPGDNGEPVITIMLPKED